MGKWWANPGMIVVYVVAAGCGMYLYIPKETFDEGLIKLYEKATSYRTNANDDPGSYKGGSKTKRHKKQKKHKSKKH
jgi:hypothetical protein